MCWVFGGGRWFDWGIFVGEMWWWDWYVVCGVVVDCRVVGGGWGCVFCVWVVFDCVVGCVGIFCVGGGLCGVVCVVVWFVCWRVVVCVGVV